MSRFATMRAFLPIFRTHWFHTLLSAALILGNGCFLAVVLGFLFPALQILFFNNEGGAGIASSGAFQWITNLFDRVMPAGENRRILSLVLMPMGLVANHMFAFLVLYVNSGLMVKITRDCRKEVFRSVQRFPLLHLQTYPRGELVQLFGVEIRGAYNVFKDGLKSMENMVNVLVISVFPLLLSWKLTLIVGAGVLLTGVANISIGRIIHRLAKAALACRFRLTDMATEAIWGIKQARLLRAESLVAARVDSHSYKNELAFRRSTVVGGIQPLVTQVMLPVIAGAVLACWYIFPSFPNGIDPNHGLFVFLLYVTRLTTPLVGLSQSFNAVIGNLPSLHKVADFLHEASSREEAGGRCLDPFLAHDIRFNHVAFAYPRAERPILHEISLTIQAGDYLGIVGPSGQGKSTFLNLFPRLFDPAKGSITVDGVDIRDIDLTQLRNGIGFLSQDFFLFNTSIRENLLLARQDATEGDLWEALRHAGLEDTFLSLPEGLDYRVGNNGERLSGGQRQRLCLAAIFLRRVSLLILDEGLSAVDKDTEEYVLSAIRHINEKGVTVISCAHNLATLRDAKRIFRISEGHLLPQGGAAR